MKGSQLTQLKSALSQAGLSRQPQSSSQNSRKRKRAASAHETDKDKKATKLKEIHSKFNPFDIKETKLKHDVGGRKLKGVVGRPGQSKQAGIEQRKNTLLVEYKQKNRAGGFIDRRFGESDPNMTAEDRMLERFTKERQRASKGVAFNLEDDEDLTHYGQSLSKLDDFDGADLGLEDGEEDGGRGQIDADTVRKSHFCGFSDEEDSEGQPPRKKSKAEVMAEVIAKSKEHKYERQVQKERDEHVRHQLDQDFDSIRSLLLAPEATGSNNIPLGRIREPSTVTDQGYDQFVKELAFDKRSKPKDRTKTEEELALEEKEALEKAERARLRRMMGEEEPKSDDDGIRRKRKRGGDDVDDDFDDGVEDPLESLVGKGLGEHAVTEGIEEEENGDEEESGGEEESGEESGGEKGGNSENLDDIQTEGASEVEEEGFFELVTSSKPRLLATKEHPKELPFTFPCPDSHDDFLDIIENVEDHQVATVVQRIRALYHPSLGVDNKFKLQNFCSILIDHVLYVAASPTPSLEVINGLVPHIFALTKAYPIASAEAFRAKLILMQKNLTRGLQHPLDSESKTFPGLPELTLLRIVGAVWPTSDLNHVVVNPAKLLMGAYLGLGRIRSLKDLGCGVFLCTLFLQYENLSKRLVPEAINFLINSLLHVLPTSFRVVEDLPGCFPAPDFNNEALQALRLKSTPASDAQPRPPNLVHTLSESGGDLDQIKIDLMGTVLILLRRFAELYKPLEAFAELFEPLLQVLEKVDISKLCSALQKLMRDLIDSIGRLIKFSLEARQPLLLQAHKPIPIATYVPKFSSSSSSYIRNRDPDPQRNASAKLRAQIREEKKGAIRELRKDNRFMAGVADKEREEKDQLYKQRMGKVFGSIESERAEQKKMEKEKARDKRRSGRK